FLPGPLAWLGKKKAVDDRDFSDAQSECVRKFNKEASKNKDENFTVDASGFNCNDIKVWKYGKYYTHHITVQNLEAEKEYFFRVGDGVISYSKGKTDGVVYVER
ncbi:fibronectin type III domain-containing protein, partial [Escherichia coli]